MNPPAKGINKRASLGVSLFAFAVLTGLCVVIFRGMIERDRLESRNDAERTMNTLLAGLRDHDDFGSAIEAIESLKKKVTGVAVYATGGARIYAWGRSPESFTEPIPQEEKPGDAVRKYVENPKNDSLILFLHPFRVGPPPPHDSTRDSKSPSQGKSSEEEKHGFLFTTMRKGEVVYLEILEHEYWAKRRLETWSSFRSSRSSWPASCSSCATSSYATPSIADASRIRRTS